MMSGGAVDGWDFKQYVLDTLFYRSFAESELNESVVISRMETTTEHDAIAGKTQTKSTMFYNLDMIIAIGYSVQSQVATRFRRWAMERPHEYIQKGFAMDDERLKQGGGHYWKELLDHIRDIGLSVKFPSFGGVDAAGGRGGI